MLNFTRELDRYWDITSDEFDLFLRLDDWGCNGVNFFSFNPCVIRIDRISDTILRLTTRSMSYDIIELDSGVYLKSGSEHPPLWECHMLQHTGTFLVLITADTNEGKAQYRLYSEMLEEQQKIEPVELTIMGTSLYFNMLASGKISLGSSRKCADGYMVVLQTSLDSVRVYAELRLGVKRKMTYFDIEYTSRKKNKSHRKR